jgi:hypothetical protein
MEAAAAPAKFGRTYTDLEVRLLNLLDSCIPALERSAAAEAKLPPIGGVLKPCTEKMRLKTIRDVVAAHHEVML